MVTDVSIQVYGGLRAWRGDVELSVPGHRAGLVLAALTVGRGTGATRSELARVVWGEDAPSTSVNQLHRLVGRLRRMFQPELASREAGDVLLGTPDGYRLAATVDTDLARLEQLLSATRDACREGRWGEAEATCDEALSLVQRPAFADVGAWATDLPEFVAVERQRLVVAGEGLDLVLSGHGSDRLLPLVEPIVARWPFEEDLQARLVRALARGGRRSDALALYDQVRVRLRDELGVDPGAGLRSAQAEVLSLDDPATSSRAAPPPSGPPAPAQLPAGVLGLTARPEAQQLLDSIADAGEASTVLVTAIGGMGGIGKTTLAVAWAHSLAPRFPDGQLYLNLRGFDADGRVMTPFEAVTRLLASLGISVGDDADLETRTARFRSALSGRRLLVLLDNARDSDQVRPLLPGSPGCLVIVTSRNRLTSLVLHEGAVPVPLDRMDDDQSRDLLRRRLGPHVLQDESAVRRVVAACAGLPLALSLIAARVATHPELTVREVADELDAAPDGGLAAWATDDPADDLSSVFALSYDALDADTARVWRLLAVHPGIELSLPSVASLVGRPRSEVRGTLRRLVGANLLQVRGTDRFSLHDLLRAFARSLLPHDPERETAERRLVDHYVRSTRAAWSTYGRPPVGELDPPDPHVAPEELTDAGAAGTWYEAERAVLIALIHLAFERGWDRAAANLAIDWRPMNQTMDPPADTEPHARVALRAAERLGDPVLLAELLRDVGARERRLGRPEEAVEMLQRALSIYEETGDLIGQANALRNLALVVPLPETPALHRRAVAMARRANAPGVEAAAGAGLLAVLVLLHRWEEALEAGLEVRELVEAQGLDYLLPNTMANLCETLTELGRPAEAIACAEAGLAVVHHDPGSEAMLAANLAVPALQVGDHEMAAGACARFRRVVAQHGDEAIDLFTDQTLQDLLDNVRSVESRLGSADGGDAPSDVTGVSLD